MVSNLLVKSAVFGFEKVTQRSRKKDSAIIYTHSTRVFLSRLSCTAVGEIGTTYPASRTFKIRNQGAIITFQENVHSNDISQAPLLRRERTNTSRMKVEGKGRLSRHHPVRKTRTVLRARDEHNPDVMELAVLTLRNLLSRTRHSSSAFCTG